MTSSSADFTRWGNVLYFLEYRGVRPRRSSREQTEAQIVQEMYATGYVVCRGVHPVGERAVQVYLVAGSQSKALTNIKTFTAMLATADAAPTEIIFFFPELLKTSRQRAIAATFGERAVAHTHININTRVPLGTMCHPHRLLPREEIEWLGEDQILEPKIIRAGDPQCVWLGAKPGDVVEIRGHQRDCGPYVTYRVVVRSEDMQISGSGTTAQDDQVDTAASG